MNTNVVNAQTIAQDTIEHRIVQTVMLPTSKERQMMLLPLVSGTGMNASIRQYMLFKAKMPYPQTGNRSRQLQNVWLMMSTDNRYNPKQDENGQLVFNQANPVGNSNIALFQRSYRRIVEGKPVFPTNFNAVNVTGTISEEFVPANPSVDVSDVANAAANVQKTLVMLAKENAQEIPDQIAVESLKETLKQKMAEYHAIKQFAVDENRMVKSHVILVQDNGYQPVVCIAQGMDVPASQHLNANALWADPTSPLTYTTVTNIFTGYVNVTKAAADPVNPNFVFGYQAVGADNENATGRRVNNMSSNRVVSRKLASIGHAGRKTDIRLEMYDNGNENNRAKIFENNTERNEDFVILDGRLIAQPYYAQTPDGSIFQAVRFHVEINQYLNIGMVGNRAQTPDVTDIEGISDAIIVEDFEVPEIEAKVPEAAEPVRATRQPRGKKAAQETNTEGVEQAQQSIDELLEGAEAI